MDVYEASELVDDDIAYWLNNPFMDRDALAQKVCWWIDRARQTPAGGHAPEGGAAGTAANGLHEREAAPAPPAGQSIEPTIGIRPDCPTCTWPNRETVGMVCQSCGFDYGTTTTGNEGI